MIRLGWREIAPTDAARDAAARQLERYELRAADALQLGAALVWCGDRPCHRKFLCSDERLGQAASTAGFDWVRL